MKILYRYRVIKSKSPEVPVGLEFVGGKLHDDRRKDKTVELSDVSCRDYTLELVETYTNEEWENKKKEKLEKLMLMKNRPIKMTKQEYIKQIEE